MYMCSFLVRKKRVLFIASLTLKIALRCYPYIAFIGLIFHNTIETCLKRIEHGGYELLENEMCRFAEDMS